MVKALYEDNWFLIVDKPAGLLTIPTPKKESRTLLSMFRFFPCHRLDKDTSGLLIFAKDRHTQDKMMSLFKQRKIKKTYIALVQGALGPAQAEIKIPIEGKPAFTRYRVVKKAKGFTIVEVMPLSGRTNQLRIHFKAIGHPIVGEKKFAFRKDFKLKANRLMLHASRLEFVHPMTGKIVSLESELPLAMMNFLAKHKIIG